MNSFVFKNAEQMSFQREACLLQWEMAERVWQEHSRHGNDPELKHRKMLIMPGSETAFGKGLIDRQYIRSQLGFVSAAPKIRSLLHLFSVDRSLDSLCSGPQVKEITVIKCHDENRKMSFLLVLQRDLKFNSCLRCAHVPRPTRTHTHTHTDREGEISDLSQYLKEIPLWHDCACTHRRIQACTSK